MGTGAAGDRGEESALQGGFVFGLVQADFGAAGEAEFGDAAPAGFFDDGEGGAFWVRAAISDFRSSHSR